MSTTPAQTSEFIGGYPTAATSRQLYDELDYQRAVQAYIWATPAVGMEAISEGTRELGTSITTIGIFENFLDAKTVVATGNGQSLYALDNIDLSQTGPVVIEVPPAVLGFIMSLWQQPLEDLGPLGPDKGKGGKYLLLPPGYEGEVPDGYFVVRSDTCLINWVVRGFVKDGKPDFAVASLSKMRIYKLSDRDHPPPMRVINVSGKAATLVPVGEKLGGLSYFVTIAKFLQREPVREQDKQFLGMLAPLGIEKGKPFAPDARLRDILTRAAKTGQAMVTTLSFDSRHPRKLRWPGASRWEEVLLTSHPDYVGPNYVELEARAGLYYQAAGASKHVLEDVVGAGSKYAASFRDSNGEWLLGDRNYSLRIPANPPVKDFWSVVVYDAITRSMIDTDQAVSGHDSYQKLLTNPDGSVDLYLGPVAPAGKESNWVKTRPGTGFFLYFRWYGPLQPYFDKSWTLPDPERVK
jgi:hypothetical protein